MCILINFLLVNSFKIMFFFVKVKHKQWLKNHNKFIVNDLVVYFMFLESMQHALYMNLNFKILALETHCPKVGILKIWIDS